jgi:hypothetical protein
MEPQTLSSATVWADIAALFLAVFVPLIIWCIYAYRMRLVTLRSHIGLAAAEIAALIAIAILAHF